MSMNIYAPHGTKVRFLGTGGYDHHLEFARKFMTVGSIWTVDRTAVSDWHTDVYFTEMPNRAFNSVMFEEVAD